MRKRSLLVPVWLLLCAVAVHAQDIVSQFPDAPQRQAQAQQLTPALNSATTNSPRSLPPDSTGEMLTRQQAEQLALTNNPRISVAALLALAQEQVVRETRSALLPALHGNLTGVDAEEASRISVGSLDASRLLYHVGAGVDLNQLITDFGRTRNLVASSSFQAKASEQQSEATREDIVLTPDLAFYHALEAQATLQVAKSTVKARQAVGDQVNALTASKLKSTLDQSFAQVNLSQAQLLALDSQNQFDAALANLEEVLGTTSNQPYQLLDDPSPPLPVAASADALIALALQQRPDLLALKLNHEADVRFSRAQHEQLLHAGLVWSGRDQYRNTDLRGFQIPCPGCGSRTARQGVRRTKSCPHQSHRTGRPHRLVESEHGTTENGCDRGTLARGKHRARPGRYQISPGAELDC